MTARLGALSRPGALSAEETADRAQTADRWPRAAVWSATVVGLLVLHALLRRSMDGFLLADGTGYLANARWLVGEAGDTWQGPAAFYHAGWSAVIAPVYLFTRAPDVVHDAVLAVNAVLASLSFLAYAAVAERVFALRRWPAVLAGLVGAAYPAVLLQAGFEWSESLFHLLFPLLVLAVAWLLRSDAPLAGIVCGLTAAALYATHPKGLGAVAAVGVGLGVLGARRRIDHWAALGGIAALAAGLIATRLVHADLQDALYAESSAAIEGDVLGRITDPALIWGAFRALWGQLWYLTVASLGLFPLGVVTLAGHRDRRLAGLVLGTCLAILAASCLQMSDGTRVDHMIYGRYDEGFLPVLLVAGVAGLLAHRRRAVGMAVIAAGLAAVLGALTVLLNGGDRFTGDVMPLNVTGILVYRTEDAAVSVLATTLLALVAMTVVAVISRARVIAGVGLLVVLFAGSSAWAEAREIRPWADYWSSVTEIPEVIDRIGYDGSIGYDLATYEVDAADLYQLELTDVGPLRFFDSASTTHRPGAPLVIASRQWHEPGARLVYPETGPYDQALWVQPGALQDELDARGLLVPEPYSAPLTLDGRAASLEVERDGDQLVVHVTNDGHTWLPVGPIRGLVQGAVRLGARWYDERGNEVGSETGELPRTMLPGDEVTIRLDAPPPPTAGRVVVSLRQEGIAWWDESAVTVVTRSAPQ